MLAEIYHSLYANLVHLLRLVSKLGYICCVGNLLATVDAGPRARVWLNIEKEDICENPPTKVVG